MNQMSANLTRNLEQEVGTELKAKNVKYPWFALQVRARHEQGVADHLQGKGYEWFLPLYKCRKRWSDRVKTVDAPLFPGYLFCRFNAQDRLPILKTPGVMQIVGFNGLPAAVDESEINAIQTLIKSGVPSQPWPFLATGDRVRIESGPFRELEGILVKSKGDHRLVLSVLLLQRSVAVEIDSAFVTPLRPSSVQSVEKVYARNELTQFVV
jgi:transcription antitermination factor NusG